MNYLCQVNEYEAYSMVLDSFPTIFKYDIVSSGYHTLVNISDHERIREILLALLKIIHICHDHIVNSCITNKIIMLKRINF